MQPAATSSNFWGVLLTAQDCIRFWVWSACKIPLDKDPQTRLFLKLLTRTILLDLWGRDTKDIIKINGNHPLIILSLDFYWNYIIIKYLLLHVWFAAFPKNPGLHFSHCGPAALFMQLKHSPVTASHFPSAKGSTFPEQLHLERY